VTQSLREHLPLEQYALAPARTSASVTRCMAFFALLRKDIVSGAEHRNQQQVEAQRDATVEAIEAASGWRPLRTWRFLSVEIESAALLDRGRDVADPLGSRPSAGGN
jgi:very-short-patch-repair endonuclease